MFEIFCLQRDQARGWVIGLSLIGLLMLGPGPATAQQPADMVYIVQSGDTVALIAMRHQLPIYEIARVNQLTYPYVIYPGQQLILPGVPAASARPQFSGYSPSPDVSSQSLPAPHQASDTLPSHIQTLHTVQSGETLFSIAQRYNLPVEPIILVNGIVNPDALQIGQMLQIPDGAPLPPPVLPDPFVEIQLSEPLIIQGRTLGIRITLSQVATLRGDIDGSPLAFFGSGQHKWSVTAIHALAPAGQYALRFIATLPNGREVTTFRNVMVVEGPYGTENIQLDAERGSLLDPEISMAEWERLVALWTPETPRPLWSGPFRHPVDLTSTYITSNFGTRRSYNSGPMTSFHGGTDFAGGPANAPIYAPAAGRVVLAENLAVRGNAVLIDHGLGLYSGYWHQSSIAVQEGQLVQPGDLIGYIGDTGLVTGPHLHWELRLQGFAVEPLQWTNRQDTIFSMMTYY